MSITKTIHAYFVDNHCFSCGHRCGGCASQLWSTSLIAVRLPNHFCGNCKMKHFEKDDHREKIYYPMVVIMLSVHI